MKRIKIKLFNWHENPNNQNSQTLIFPNKTIRKTFKLSSSKEKLSISLCRLLKVFHPSERLNKRMKVPVCRGFLLKQKDFGARGRRKAGNKLLRALRTTEFFSRSRNLCRIEVQTLRRAFFAASHRGDEKFKSA